MPNWCSTTYHIKGDEKELDKLYGALEEIKQNALIKTDFGNGWLGHILDYLGFAENEICYGEIGCRGYITWMEKNDDIRIDTETAWSPMPKPLLLLCEKVAPNLRILYTAIECGCELYLTNDPKVDGSYVLDVMDYSDDLPEDFKELEWEFLSKEEMKKLLSKALSRDDDIESLIEETEDRWGEYLNIHEFEYEDIENFN